MPFVLRKIKSYKKVKTMRTYGTQATGIRTPIIYEGDNLPKVVVDSLLKYRDETNTKIEDFDIIGITEAIVARAQGNYATVEQISADVKEKVGTSEVGIVFPILSRNRFSILLKGIAAAFDKVYIQLSYPSDEVGNHIISPEDMHKQGVNPYSEVFCEEEFRGRFGEVKHHFTSVDYMEFYRELAPGAEIILANDPCEILKHTKTVIAADIHTRELTKKRLLAGGAQAVFGLDDFLTSSVNGSGYSEDHGLLGSNKSTDDKVKLFPRDCDAFVTEVQRLMFEKTGAKVEVLVYGDGAFKDPVGKIWELADPVVSPSFTAGLKGLPNEIKLKYIADNEFADMRGDQAREAIIEKIKNKSEDVCKTESQGTTPRQLTDLIGSLCDLVSGSGDKGTPVVYIKGYFDNYAS